MPTFLLIERGGAVKKAVRGADAAGIKALIAYARKKSEGVEVSEAEEAAFAKVEFEGGGVG